MRSLILLLLFPFVSIPSGAMTLSDIKVEVRRYINDKADPRVKYTDSQLTSFINETQREVVNQTWCLTNRSTQSLSVNTTYYSLPTDLIAIDHVEFKDASNRTRELTEVSQKATQQNNPEYERQTGPPMTYFVRNSTAATSYQLQIAVLPVPSSTTATGLMTIDYYSQATSLSAASDVPFDGARDMYPYHYTLVYGTVAKIKMIQSDPSAPTFFQMYQSDMKLMTDRLGSMPNYNPRFGSAPSK